MLAIPLLTSQLSYRRSKGSEIILKNAKYLVTLRFILGFLIIYFSPLYLPMKHLLLLLFTLSSTILFSQIIRVDSISYEDLNNGTNYTTEFTYGLEGNNADKVIKATNFYPNLDFTFICNDAGNYDLWVIEEEGYPSRDVQFIYDDNNELDTILIELMFYGYLVKQIYDVEFETGLISSVVQTEDYAGYPFVIADRNMEYENGKLSKISELDIFYYTGDEIANHIFTYEIDKLMSREFTDFSYGINSFKDSLVFGQTGLTNQVTRFFADEMNDPYNIVYTEKINVLPSDLALTPFDEYYTTFLIFDDDFFLPELFTLMNRDIPESHILNGNGELIRGTWNYSLLVNNKETKINAKIMSIHPNPSSSFVSFDVDSEIKKTTIYNISGELIHTNQSNEKTIDVQHLSSGTYLITVETKDGDNYFSKLIKE